MYGLNWLKILPNDRLFWRHEHSAFVAGVSFYHPKNDQPLKKDLPWSQLISPLKPKGYYQIQHSEVACFLWCSEQTAVVSLRNINWLVCIMKTECVYCAVRAAVTWLGWLVSAEARVLSQARFCDIYGGQSGSETSFSLSTSVFPCHHSTSVPYSSSTHCSYQKGKWAKPGNLSKGSAFSSIGRH